MDEIAQVHSSCRDCVFADYNDIFQVGCHTGRLDKYKESAEVLEVYDDEKEFYVINNRVCNMQRSGEWADAQEDDPFVAVYNELIEQFIDVGIFADDESWETILESVLDQTLRAATIHLIVKDAKHQPYVYLEKLRETGRSFKLHSLVGEGSLADVTNFVAKNCDSLYYAVIQEPIPNEFLSDVHYRVNIEARPFSLLKNDSVLIVTAPLHKLLNGSTDVPIWTKIENIAEEQNKWEMILTSLTSQ